MKKVPYVAKTKKKKKEPKQNKNTSFKDRR